MILAVVRTHFARLKRDRAALVLSFVVPVVFFSVFASIFGGARNATLMRALKSELAPRRVATTADEGVPVEHVEALAFAWLAREAMAGRAGNLPAVTGAHGPRVLGAIYPR